MNMKTKKEIKTYWVMEVRHGRRKWNTWGRFFTEKAAKKEAKRAREIYERGYTYWTDFRVVKETVTREVLPPIRGKAS